jgi:lysophospholipase L1-like esterase
VIVLSIPDWGVTPFAANRDRSAIAEEIDRYNTINSEATAQAGAHYVDVTPISRGAASDSFLLASDGLHPSGAMYEDWARLVLPVAKRALDSR